VTKQNNKLIYQPLIEVNVSEPARIAGLLHIYFRDCACCITEFLCDQIIG